MNQLLGIKSRVVDPQGVKELCLQLDVSDRPSYLIMGALYHAPGGIIRHDAVVWGMPALRTSSSRSTPTPRMGFERNGDRIVAVETPRGPSSAGRSYAPPAGHRSVAGLARGLRSRQNVLQAFVTEPMKLFLDVIIVSRSPRTSRRPTAASSLIGAEIEPYTTYKVTDAVLPSTRPSTRSKLFLSSSGSECSAPGPLCDLSPDYSPARQDRDRQLPSLRGVGNVRFKAALIVGVTLAELVASGKTSDLIAPFALERFHTDTLVSELAAAAEPLASSDEDADAIQPRDRPGATLRPILDVASEVGLVPEEVEPYGRYKAKVDLSVLERLSARPDAKLINVTAITPTPAGEGKTTTSVSLTQGLGVLGKKPVLCLREASLGPVLGSRGAAGGGYAQVVPMEDLNLHFTATSTRSRRRTTSLGVDRRAPHARERSRPDPSRSPGGAA